MTDESEDRLAIRALTETWALSRDSLDWERFRTVWHDDGRMMATWWQGPYEDFIGMTNEGVKRGLSIVHSVGGGIVDIEGDRAVAQTKMTISQRAEVEGVVCDVLCMTRAYDFIERRDGRWAFVLRQGIYEKDRLDPVVPGTAPKLDPAVLEQFPEGYRHLAYLQHGLGYPIKADMPGLVGPEVDQLYADGAAWLRGEPLPR